MATPVIVVASGGLPVREAADNHGAPMTPTESRGIPVTITTGLGIPVTFVGVDGVLWPGGVAP